MDAEMVRMTKIKPITASRLLLSFLNALPPESFGLYP
jgi:hypothetical protein